MKRGIIYLAASAALCASVAIARDVFVTANYIYLYDGQGSYYSAVVKAPKGTDLSVLEESGKWLKVKTVNMPDQKEYQGYVCSTALAPNKPDMSGFNGVAADSTLSTGAAAKGVGPHAAQYATGKNLDTQPFQQLIDLRANIPTQEFIDFDKQGKVGIAKP